MKALVLTANARLELLDRPVAPPLTDDSLLIKIHACGICGSDIPRAFNGKAYHYPLVMGHEFSGEVTRPGTASAYKAGDRVAIFPLLPCRKCSACQTGNYAQCSNYNYFGSRCDGGFQEFLKVPAANLLPVPEHVHTLHATMTEPAAVALHGVRKMKITAGDTAVVFGGGPIGNMAAQWLRIHGCSEIMVVDNDERKLKIAEDMGFIPVSAQAGDAVEKIMKITGGLGAIKVIEAVGLPITFLQAIRVAALYGEVVFLGNLSGTFQIDEKDFTHILRKELSIYGTWNSKITPAGTDDWTTALKYMDKELQVAPLISSTPRLEEGPAVFESILNRKEFHNKVILKIG
jgi:L-iditol 2-dehydrogenase